MYGWIAPCAGRNHVEPIQSVCVFHLTPWCDLCRTRNFPQFYHHAVKLHKCFLFISTVHTAHRNGREAYSGLNGPQSVFFFYNILQILTLLPLMISSPAQRNQKIYVCSNTWLSVVFLFFLFPISNWMCLFIALGSAAVSATLLFAGCYWISLPLFRLYWSVKYICISAH